MRSHPRPPAFRLRYVLSLVIGGEFAITARMVQQLLPGGEYEHVSLWAGLVCGVGVGMLWARRVFRCCHQGGETRNMVGVAMFAAVIPAVVLVLLPMLTHALLWLNATVSVVLLLMACRAVLTGLVAFSFGALWGLLWVEGGRVVSDRRQSPVTSHQSPVAEGSFTPGMLWGAAGLLIVRSLWLAPGWTLAVLGVSAGLTGLCVWGAAQPTPWWTKPFPLVPRVFGAAEGRTDWKSVLLRRDWAAAAGTLTMVVLALLLRHNYQPGLAARLLFSTQTFAAYSSGTDRELLPHLDAARLITVVDGPEATWTVWKQGGVRLHLRRDGLPHGTVSTQPHVCPQFAGDVMHAVLPLTLHEQPNDVLMLGLGNTVALSSCLACPVRTVTCVEGDRGLIRIVDRMISPQTGVNPLQDDRVHLLTVDPTLATMADERRYDVILVAGAQPSTLESTAEFTQQWWARLRERLGPDGIVCQRFPYADLGRQPLEDVIVTLRSVFPQVICLESAPGEMLLIASNTNAPMDDDQFLSRCEAPQVRRLLAQVGWDWSVIVNLTALQRDGGGGESGVSGQESPITNHHSLNGRINTVANGHFAFGLPQEVMRWGPKWQEIRRLWAEHGSRMLDWVGESWLRDEVAGRLADMAAQHRLIAEHGDRYWAYRQTLKQRLTDRPRAKIVPVRHEGLNHGLHPEDERRKEYLAALGRAVATPESVADLSEFAEPYDPLVSYFLHREAARLYEGSDSHRQARLDHLRYSIYFAPPGDRSVRNVARVIGLLLDHPELMPDAQDRWDELNGLLEILSQRCALRMQSPTGRSRFELGDVEQARAAANRALLAMDDLRSKTSVAAASWDGRRTVLERNLIRPMRTYQAAQAQKLATVNAQQKRVAESAELDPSARRRSQASESGVSESGVRSQ